MAVRIARMPLFSRVIDPNIFLNCFPWSLNIRLTATFPGMYYLRIVCLVTGYNLTTFVKVYPWSVQTNKCRSRRTSRGNGRIKATHKISPLPMVIISCCSIWAYKLGAFAVYNSWHELRLALTVIIMLFTTKSSFNAK